MDFIRNKPELSALIAFIVGLVIGWFVIGWGVWKVEYIDSDPASLHSDYKATYIETAALAYAETGNNAVVANAFRGWEAATTDICALWSGATDPVKAAQIDALIGALQEGQNCTSLGNTAVETQPETSPVTEPEQTGEEGGNNFVTILLLLLLLVVLVAAIYYVVRKRNELMADDEPVSRYELPDEGPASMEGADDGMTAVPIAKFTSSYSYGRDNYDDSYSIENTDSDFLGECGVGISESIGTNTPKNVTAFEVWLFDKNDIRTETKVLMSDHAFFDEALKAKLAPKGEPVLARENEVLVLETAALIINATVKDMQYGTDNMPPQSYFQTITLEISAWAKEAASYDDVAVQDEADTLNY
jgi:hypothetical protein